MAKSEIELTTIDFMRLNGQSMWLTNPNNTSDDTESPVTNPDDPYNAIKDMERIEMEDE